MKFFTILCIILVVSTTGFSIKVPSKVCGAVNLANRVPTNVKGSRNLLRSVRGGYAASDFKTKLNILETFNTPSKAFDACLLAIVGVVCSWKLGSSIAWKNSSVRVQEDTKKTADVKSLQARFLCVFWLLRMSDWLQGPYFFEVFSSKSFRGEKVSTDLVAKIFLLGFATTGAVGPILGRLVDSIGRKKGTLAFTVMYALSALSTLSNNLGVVLLGRVAGGLGTSLLFTAPEAWLVGEHERQCMDGKWLGETFGWAYAGDAVVAIAAGQLATVAARHAGPTGPFLLSVAFLAAGAGVTLWKWGENTPSSVASSRAILTDTLLSSSPSQSKLAKCDAVEDRQVMVIPLLEKRQTTIRSAVAAMLADRRIMLLGAVQALFEGAMYIFVLQWPPLFRAAVHSSSFGADASVPYGSIFSCFMASCLVGSTLFGSLQRSGVATEKSAALMLGAATAALATATHLGQSHLAGLTAALLVFEACVGMYFPSIGSLRSKYLPEEHRSVMMNLFGIPLNLIVVSIVLRLKSLGMKGALNVASAALGAAAVCMWQLHSMMEIGTKQQASESTSE